MLILSNLLNFFGVREKEKKIANEKKISIKCGDLFSEFEVSPGPSHPFGSYGAVALDMPIYKQLDSHSCGFLAVHATVNYLFNRRAELKPKRTFPPKPCDIEILKAVNATNDDGCDQEKVLLALEKLLVKAKFVTDLDEIKIHENLREGRPIIVTVLGEGWGCDHWTVIRGIDLENGFVFHSNLGQGIMDWKDFEKIWYDKCQGIICSL